MGIKLASRVATVQESATLALNARAKQLAAEGQVIYNLTAGELTTDTPDFIQKAVAAKLYLNKYTAVAGLPELREAIAVQAREYYDLDWIKPENVVVTAGAKPALCATFMALLDAGDEVLVPVPGWTTSYKPLIELAGGVMVEVSLTDQFDLDVAAITSHITPRTKAIILNSPHNPTGATFSKRALTELSAALKGKDLTVIADDIYVRLAYEADFALVAQAGFENLIIINGFSKSQALTGWRIGYLIADKAVADATINLLSHITGNAPLPSQYAGLTAMIEVKDTPPQTTIDALKQQRQLVADNLTAAGIPFVMPGGAFYFFLDVRRFGQTSAAWCEQLLIEHGVVLVPGEAFSMPGFARLTFVAGPETLRPALDKIAEFVKAGKS